MRLTATVCSALLARRSAPLLRYMQPDVLPDDAGMGDVLHSIANVALLLEPFGVVACGGELGGAPGLKALDCKQRRAVLLDHVPHEGLDGVCLVPGALPSASAAPSSIFRADSIILSWDMPSQLLRTSSGAVLVSESVATWTSSAQDTQALARHEQRPQLVEPASAQLGDGRPVGVGLVVLALAVPPSLVLLLVEDLQHPECP